MPLYCIDIRVFISKYRHERGFKPMNIHKIEASRIQELEKKRVCAYVRVSTGKDAQLESSASQIDYFKKTILANPLWEFKGVYADEDFTGTKANRPEFTKMYKACQDGEIDLILTKSISRFARNTVVLLSTIRELKNMGIGVYFERENIFTLDAEGELLLTLLASFAQEESRSASENMKWSIRNAYKEGSLRQVRRTYGYLVENEKVTIVLEEATIVEEIFLRYSKGESPSAIMRDLNRRGVKTLKGCKWSVTSLNNMTANVFYTGNTILQKFYVPNHLDKKLRSNNGQLDKYFVRDSHEAIISMELFEQVQEIKQARTFKKAKNYKHVFSGLITCGICGANFQRKHDRGKKKWLCGTYKKKGPKACPSKQIPEDTLEKVLCEALAIQGCNLDSLLDKVDKITTFNGNKLLIHCKDGSEISTSWEDKSRADSWTKEMRELAGQKTKERYKHAKKS